MKKIKNWFGVFIVSVALSSPLWYGCNSPSLQSGGAYSYSTTNLVAGTTNWVVTTTADLQLYQADTAFKLAYDTLNAVFLIERNNRTYLWNISPGIKHTLDSIRPGADKAVDEYLAARAAYIANPTPAGLTGMTAIITKIQQALFAANAAIGVGTITTNSTPSTP